MGISGSHRVLLLIAVSWCTPSALGARKLHDPQIALFSDWSQDDAWHESFRVARGRGAMWRQWTTEADRQAVCNDGSPGAFYVRRGQGQGLNRWLIRFQGSQYCWDAQSCDVREHTHSHFLTTSNYTPEWISNTLPERPEVYPWMLKALGVLNVDPILNPLWHNWNHVYLFPCSSDAFMGDAPASADMPWHFRGRRYVFAAFQLLLERFQLTEATDVLLVGDSTGGAGMLQLVDDLQELVSGRAPLMERFKAWVDGGWMYPAQQPDGGEFFFSPGHLSLAHRNLNATFHRKCAQHYPDEPWQCFYAANIWPHIATPVLFHHCLYDEHARMYLLGDGTPESGDPEQWEKLRASYMSSYRLHEEQTAAMSRTERMTLQIAEPKARLPTLFSPACTWHQMSDADAITASSHVGQLSFLEVFKDWFLGLEDEVYVVDNHPGPRPTAPPRNEAQWTHRGNQYYNFAQDRRSLGLPADIYETEPDFLMEALPVQPEPEQIIQAEYAVDATGPEAETVALLHAASEGDLTNPSASSAADDISMSALSAVQPEVDLPFEGPVPQASNHQQQQAAAAEEIHGRSGDAKPLPELAAEAAADPHPMQEDRPHRAIEDQAIEDAGQHDAHGMREPQLELPSASATLPGSDPQASADRQQAAGAAAGGSGHISHRHVRYH